MNTKKRNIYIGLLTMFLPLVWSLSFTSCSDDYAEQVFEGETETVGVRLSVSANSMGGVGVSRAYNGDENAEEGEFIHSLCVYVVEKDDGKIVKKYCTDDEDAPLTFSEEEQKLANEGNLLEWTSDDRLNLETGKAYIVYAFANWETTWAGYFDTTLWDFIAPLDEDARIGMPWYKLIYDKSVGGTITEEDINFSVNHPAEKIDIDNHYEAGSQYIPMSGRLEITGGRTAVTVELVRLVAKVEMTMQIDINTPDAETDYYYPLQWAALGYFAEMVPLFEDGDLSEYLYYYDYVGWPNVFFDNDYPIGLIPVNSGEAYSIDKRYVNETNLDNMPSDIYYELPGFFSEWVLDDMLDDDYMPVEGYGYQELWGYSTLREFKRNEYWTLQHVYSGGQLILTDVINWSSHGEEILDVVVTEGESGGN